MLGSSCFSIISLVFRFGVFIKAISYNKWDIHNHQFIFKPLTRKQYTINILVLILCNLHFSFVMYNCFHQLFTHDGSMSKFMFQFALGFPAGIGCVLRLGFVRKEEEFVTMMNYFIKLEKQLTKEFEICCEPNLMGIILWNQAFMCCFHIVGLGVCFLVVPNTPIFLYSLLDFGEFWAILWIPIELFPYVLAWSSAMVCCICMALLVSMEYWVKELR